MERTCSNCGVPKDLDTGYHFANKAKGIKHYQCIECRRRYEQQPSYKERKAKWAREKRAKNPEKHRAQYREWKARCPEGSREQYLKFRFRITLQDYKTMLAEAGGTCFICKGPEDDKRRFSVDHDHKCCPNNEGKTCGKCIRGLLCQNCNAMLGFAQDNIEILARAQEYLKRYATNGKTDASPQGLAFSVVE